MPELAAQISRQAFAVGFYAQHARVAAAARLPVPGGAGRPELSKVSTVFVARPFERSHIMASPHRRINSSLAILLPACRAKGKRLIVSPSPMGRRSLQRQSEDRAVCADAYLQWGSTVASTHQPRRARADFISSATVTDSYEHTTRNAVIAS